MNMTNKSLFVASSWNRSKEYGIDPQQARHHLLARSELQDRKDRMRELLEASKVVLDSLSKQLKDTDTMIALSDEDGYLIASWGHPSFVDQYKKGVFDLGTNWHEETKGTNAIGLALIEQKPMSVLGNQHYCHEHHLLGCSATPLYTSTGELLGTLVISGTARTHHDYLLPLIIATGQACQARLLLHSTERELVLHLCESDLITKSYSYPLISVDSYGVIRRINYEAAQLLQLPLSECIGQPLSRWIGEEQMMSLLSAKHSSAVQLNVTRNFTSSTSSSSWSIQPVLDRRQRLFRLVLSSHQLIQEPKNSFYKGKELKMGEMVIQCPQVQKVVRFALQVARTNANILIYGETGTGKGLLAKEIHQASERKGPFLTINCGAIPAQLIESELFGYEKGAFTGAKHNGHQGKFEAAVGGTLFLDEIGEMSPMAQVALLKVLEEKVITRIGSNQSIPVDVRIIAATNKDLAKEVAEGRFRKDLYYRLREIELTLPALRERTDLLYLMEDFVGQISKELQIRLSLDLLAQKALSDYEWPGNIREMRQVIRQAAFYAYFGRESTIITMEDLSFLVIKEPPPIKLSLTSVEEEVIARAIQMTGGNLTAAARRLGIGRTTLYRKLSKYPNLKCLRNELQ
ncbi:sigma-54-dependent Fis family transcriptional regulator [Thermoflavimicrobium daqui]|jgi:transcriptional regulator of acetoin/glycerol metabolism|uniref:Sigma-54 factor interaction domain-containing protein n=1 Tax=Thermoflavimicrobium daqui TaxID=2137476 RepID=A0A364K5S8_9BACL|nr:sigma-54-dependent Fis family transcriptional regulator [Thermoflavimicrobium daqui]RAL25656.1 hypothetical protein DL897_06145 [Thermoflavimicrobium daqui]